MIEILFIRFQVESAGHYDCDPLHSWYNPRGDEDKRDPHQSDHHSRHEGSQDRQG